MAATKPLNFQHSDAVTTLPQKGIGKNTTHYLLVAIAIGAILCLAGIFLALAANQVLPHGVNAISDLGVWGQFAGYGGFAAGCIILSISGVKWYLNKQNTHVESSKSGITGTKVEEELDAQDHEELFKTLSQTPSKTLPKQKALPKQNLSEKLEAIESKFDELEEIVLVVMSKEAWKDYKKTVKEDLSKTNKTVEEIEQEVLMIVAKRAIENHSEDHSATQEELTEALNSIKTHVFIKSHLYQCRPQKTRDKELQAFYQLKGDKYAQTPLDIDITQFHGKQLNGLWTIDLNKIGTDTWLRDASLEAIDLDNLTAEQQKLTDRTNEAPRRVSFRTAFQSIANTIKHSCEHPKFENAPRIIELDYSDLIFAAAANIDFIPENRLTGKGAISWANAIVWMLKQEGYVFDIVRKGNIFLQV